MKLGADFQQTLGHFVALVAVLSTLHYTPQTAAELSFSELGKSNSGILGRFRVLGTQDTGKMRTWFLFGNVGFGENAEEAPAVRGLT